MSHRGAWRGRRADIVALALLALLPLALYARCLLPGEAFLDEDLFAIHLPLRSLVLSGWAGGDLGDWNPYLFGGFPLTGDPHAAVFYPPNRLLAWLVPDAARHLTWSTVLHTALSLTGAFVFLRRRSTTAGATAGALVWACNGFALAHAVHPGWSAALAWTGWLLCCLERARTDRRWFLAAAPVVALVALAGNPQGALLVYALTAVWTLATARMPPPEPPPAAPASAPGPRPLPAARFVVFVALTGLLGVLLAAAQLLPTLELGAQSFRTLPDLLSPQRADAGYALRLVAPLADGPPQAYTGPSTFIETTFFTGVAPWLIVAAGWRGLSRREGVALALLGATGAWLTTGVLGAASLVPPGFRAHERYFPLLAGVLAIAVARSLPHLELRRPALAVVGALLGAALVAATLGSAAPPGRELWLALGAALLVLFAASRRAGPAAPWLLVAVLVCELGAFGWRLTRPAEVAPVAASLERIAEALPPDGRSLVLGERAEPWLNAGAAVERALVRGYHPLALARTVGLLDAAAPVADTPHMTPWPAPGTPAHQRLLDVFGVTSVLTLEGGEVEVRTRRRPSARLVPLSRVEWASDPTDLPRRVLGSSGTVVEAAGPPAPPEATSAPLPEVAWSPCGPDCFEASWAGPPNAVATLLRVPLPPYPGWEAVGAADNALELAPADAVATAVALPRGATSPVRLRFRSPSVALGRQVSLAAALVWLVLAVAAVLARRRLLRPGPNQHFHWR